jgi:hypothetical protein
MKNKRSTQRSFPGRLTLEEWSALPHLGRRDMIHRAECELLHCHRLCASKVCHRHRACCADDALECERSLWQRALLHPRTLRRELARLYDLAKLPGPDRGIRKNTLNRAFWTAGLDGPWNAPSNPPWAPVPSAGTSAVPAHGGFDGGEAALDPPAWGITHRSRARDFGGEGG